MTIEYSETELEMINLLDQHVNAELQGDLDTTMATMIDSPHLLNIPNMMGEMAMKVLKVSIKIIW